LLIQPPYSHAKSHKTLNASFDSIKITEAVFDADDYAFVSMLVVAA
jgi:hypothetical protein